MKRFLTTGFLGAFLGIVIGSAPADASLISRGFLDEVLTSYATNTALDLKANKADLTDLSDKIGDAWPYMSDMSTGLNYLSWGLYPLEITLENASDLVRFLFGGEIRPGINQAGVLNLLGESVFNTGAYDINTGQIDDGFRSLLQLTNGWTDSQKKTYLGVKGLNDKIGGLNDKIGGLPTAMAFYEYDASGTLGYNKYPTAEVFGINDNIGGMLAAILQGFDVGSGRSFLSLPEISTRTVRLSDQIGTLPSGEVYQITRIMNMYDKHYPNTHDWPFRNYPTSVQDLILSLYGPSDTNPTSVGFIPHVLGIIEELVWVHEDMYQQFGTLPTEYATVGAALTAMDAKIDARELPSSSADGQYVLSAKKVGDTITYTWVKMDLTSEEQAQ